MDYFSSLQNLGGLAKGYDDDIIKRTSDINMDNQLQNQYTNAMANWEYGVESVRGKSLDEFKEWGIQTGSELGVDLLAKAYAGSALSKAVSSGIASVKGTIKEGISSAVDSAKSGVMTAVDTLGDAKDVITEGASGLAEDFAQSSFLPRPQAPKEEGIQLDDLSTGGDASASMGIQETNLDEASATSSSVGNTSDITATATTQKADITSNQEASDTFNQEMTDYQNKDYSDMDNLENQSKEEAEDGLEGDAEDDLEDDAEEEATSSATETALGTTELATADVGFGEVLMAGQALYSLGKDIYDWVHPPKPPPPPKMPTLISVPQLPTFIQASAQSGL